MKAAAVHPARTLSGPWRGVFVAGAALAIVGLVTVLPIPLPPYLDFQVLYHANMGLLRGIALYDHAAQVGMIARLAHVPPEQVFVLPFPYPPWYALSTVWLAWLPIEAAARAWFGLNAVMLVTAVVLLSRGWKPVVRLAALAAAVCFVPVLGSLLVGQYVFPVLLGCALMVEALRRERSWLAVLAALLLTFKPHLGALVLLAALVWLARRRAAFAKRSLLLMAGAGALLAALGFLADGAWPVDYARSLTGFRLDPGVSSCKLCTSLPVMIGTLLQPDAGLAAGFGVAALLMLLLLALWATRRAQLMRAPLALISAAVLTVLLASPYLLNYDFVLLLVPLAFLAGQARRWRDWLFIAAILLLPFAALVLVMLFGRAGNALYPLCALALLALVYRQVGALDGASGAAYNAATTE